MKKLSLLIIWLAVAYTIPVYGQPSAFADEIREYKKQDSIMFPPANAILFAGSSSFRMWTDVQSYFPGYTIINRGFGGSTLPDVIYYADKIIFPYYPKQIVIYCGENDLASSDTVTAALVVDRFKQLFQMIRLRLPEAKISYVSIKPSPSRIHLFDKMKMANAEIKDFIKQQENASFINVFDKMLKDCKSRPELFLEDQLHMKPEGYRIWRKKIKPHLLK